ncbi:hypothetical protein B0H14DRAFT_3883394 [Mycena olivaceomarginata]|nr:hypothetical protein B0H14DRAFT_3883394 [Mycena olivaceomarginata]
MRGATGMPSARRRPRLTHQEAIVAHPRRSYLHVRHAAPPTAFLPPQSPPRWSVACAIHRDYQRHRGPSTAPPHRARYPTRLRNRCALRAMYCATATSPHSCYSAPDAIPRRHARHHASAHPSPDPHRQAHGQRVTLAFLVPHAAFVASPHCATMLTSVPPSPLEPRACRALQYHLHHVPRPQHALRSFLITGAAFVAFSYATAVLTARRTRLVASTTRHRRPLHLRQPLYTAHPAFVASLRVLAILSAVPPLRSKPAPGAHHQRLFLITPATFVPSPCAPTICSVDPPSPLDSPACTHLGTVPSTTCVRSIRRRHSPPSALHLSQPPPSHRPTHAPPGCSTKTTAAPARRAACADGVNP